MLFPPNALPCIPRRPTRFQPNVNGVASRADRLSDDPLVPLHLLIWAVETAMSTLTCLVEAAVWESLTREEKSALAQLYVPYLVFGM